MASEPALTITDTCRVCGFSVTLSGDDARAIVAQSDAAHAALRPNCNTRVAAASETREAGGQGE